MAITKRKKPVKRKKSVLLPIPGVHIPKKANYTVKKLVKHLNAVDNQNIPVLIAPYIRLGKRSIPQAIELQEIVSFGECYMDGGYITLEIFITMFNKENK